MRKNAPIKFRFKILRLKIPCPTEFKSEGILVVFKSGHFKVKSEIS